MGSGGERGGKTGEVGEVRQATPPPSAGADGQRVESGPRPVSSALPHAGEELKPFRPRQDGMAAARRKRFIQVLGSTGCVKDAARAIGVTTTSAYRARKRLPDFAADWATALDMARTDIEQVTWKRAVEGAEVPIVRGNEIVATYRKPSDAMLRLLYTRGNSGTTLRGADGKFRAMPPPEELLTWEEWQENWRFDGWGRKYQQPGPEEMRAALTAEIREIRRRLLGLSEGEDGDAGDEDGEGGR